MEGEDAAGATLERARAVKRAHESDWLALKGVLAVGSGAAPGGGHCIVVSVARLTHPPIPERVMDGVQVRLEFVDPPRALGGKED